MSPTRADGLRPGPSATLPRFATTKAACRWAYPCVRHPGQALPSSARATSFFTAVALSRETCADLCPLHSSSASFAHDASKWPHSLIVTECGQRLIKSMTAKAGKGCKQHQHALRERTTKTKPAGEGCRARGRRLRLQMMPKWCPGPAPCRLAGGTAPMVTLGADGAVVGDGRERGSTFCHAFVPTIHRTSL